MQAFVVCGTISSAEIGVTAVKCGPKSVRGSLFVEEQQWAFESS